MELNTSDIIQLISVGVALLLGIISIIISVVSIRQNSRIVKESNKAQLEIFPFKVYGDIIPRIRIQNFGKTTGVVTSIISDPEIPDNAIDNPFDYFIGLSIAPNQAITMLFVCNGNPVVPLKEFDVTITYNTLNETVVSTQHVNYKYLDGYNESSTKPKEVDKILNNINQSIQGLLQK